MIARSTFLCSAGIAAPNRSRYPSPYRRNTSATVGMRLLRHHPLDRRSRLFLAQRRQMEVDHGGLQRAVPQVLLDQPQVDAGFKQVGGVAVTERVNRDRLAEVELLHHPAHRPLDTGTLH